MVKSRGFHICKNGKDTIVLDGTTYSGKWVYGYHWVSESYCCFANEGTDRHYIRQQKNHDWNLTSQEDYEVIPQTVGLFTGLTDKNGKGVYNGDKVKMHYFFENFNPVSLGVYEDENEVTGIVCCDNKYGTVLEVLNSNKEYVFYHIYDYVQEPTEELEVLGNMYMEV